MTFEEFQSSKVYSDDLERDGACLGHDEDEPAASGYLYCGGLYIEDGDDDEWSLILANTGWVDTNLETLERRLYQYALSEGFGGLRWLAFLNYDREPLIGVGATKEAAELILLQGYREKIDVMPASCELSDDKQGFETDAKKIDAQQIQKLKDHFGINSFQVLCDRCYDRSNPDFPIKQKD